MRQIIKKTIFVISVIAFVIITYNLVESFRSDKVEPSPKPVITKDLPVDLKDEPKIPFDKPVSILVLGADSLIPGKLEGWYGRSDFIALVYINPKQQKVHILSIPRDTQISLKKHDVSRINAANQLGGYKFAKRAVKRLVGLKKIDHVFVFSIQAVIDMIDTLGEVKIFVPQEMYYNDNSANLHINIKPGLQEMDGLQLMNFVRYRNKNKGDIGRIERQHIFFRAALRKLKEPEIVFRLPQFLFKANKAFQTDMDFSEMFQLGLLARSLEMSDFKSHIVPGDFGSDGSWLVKKLELRDMMNKITDGN
jgi:polyisoprenyl-teichoic acid--peptidoglycan teichoic acid transferase